MDVLKRLRIIKGDSKDSEARRRLQKDLFEFNKFVQHGFPNQPTAIAFDPTLSILAVGTKSGSIRIYGRPGVQFTAQHLDELTILKMLFLPEQGRLITLCEGNSLHLWELNVKDGCTVLEKVKSFEIDNSKVKAVTCWCLTSASEDLLIGTESGSVHVFNVPEFKLTEKVFTQEDLIQKASEEVKTNPGAIESILQYPSAHDQFLIGFNRGQIVLWNTTSCQSEKVYIASVQLEAMSFGKRGDEFVVSHSDGSYTVWSTADSSKPKENATTPYGPFPCKAIRKIDWQTADGVPMMIFTGGMPRASYGERHTVSVMQSDRHVVFDLSSKVVDFVTISSPESGAPDSLIILSEEELVAVDLVSSGWPVHQLPYLWSIHCSPITALLLEENVSEAVWSKIKTAGLTQYSQCSSREWPITGGKTDDSANRKHLLLTGHEDGTVHFWDVSSTPGTMRPLCKISTAELFTDLTTAPRVQGTKTEENGGDLAGHVEAEDDWPPFKRSVVTIHSLKILA